MINGVWIRLKGCKQKRRIHLTFKYVIIKQLCLQHINKDIFCTWLTKMFSQDKNPHKTVAMIVKKNVRS